MNATEFDALTIHLESLLSRRRLLGRALVSSVAALAVGNRLVRRPYASAHDDQLTPTGEPKIGYIDGVTFRQKKVSYFDVDGLAVVEEDVLLGSTADMEEVAACVEGRKDCTCNECTTTLPATVAWEERLWWKAADQLGVVPYEPPPASLAADVMPAIRHWQERTGLRLIVRTQENAHLLPDYVVFVEGNKCASMVGRQSGRQEITLAVNCGVAAAIHEIGHAVGMWHEQSRNDRDEWVEILWDNIREDKIEVNFRNKIDDRATHGAYDFDSIMHYGPYDFSKNGQPTIVSRVADKSVKDNFELSQGDITAIASVYTGPVGAGCGYGTNTCIMGYVWREAFAGDRVCVTPEVRDQAARDNSSVDDRVDIFGGPDECIYGYVWRGAAPADHVCVTSDVRDQTARDNTVAAERIEPICVQEGTQIQQPDPAGFVRFSSTREFHTVQGALARQGPTRDATIVERFPAGTSIYCNGYVHGQLVEGDDRWLQIVSNSPLFIHTSGVAESI